MMCNNSKLDLAKMNAYIKFGVILPMTSDGGNGNHSVSLPIFFIKIKVDQMLPYKLAVGLYFMILHLISYFHKCTALFLG